MCVRRHNVKEKEIHTVLLLCESFLYVMNCQFELLFYGEIGHLCCCCCCCCCLLVVLWIVSFCCRFNRVRRRRTTSQCPFPIATEIALLSHAVGSVPSCSRCFTSAYHRNIVIYSRVHTFSCHRADQWTRTDFSCPKRIVCCAGCGHHLRRLKQKNQWCCWWRLYWI